MGKYYAWRITDDLKRTFNWSPEGRKRRSLEMKSEREGERVVKQKTVTPKDAVNGQIRRKAGEYQ
jgi:hypothetical protein